MTLWNTDFLHNDRQSTAKRALIILNQPFSLALLRRIWATTEWHACADGGANRLHDILDDEERPKFLPDLIKGDLDSLRDTVRTYYAAKNVVIIKDNDQYSTDLMKCVLELQEKEQRENQEYDLVILGGLSGRLDQTIHTLSYLHKLRKIRKHVFAVTDDNVGWVLDEGEHFINIDHRALGPTCGLLPVGISQTILSTKGLKWNLTDEPSSFDGLVSTSNHFLPEEQAVWIKTTQPIWWTAELKSLS